MNWGEGTHSTDRLTDGRLYTDLEAGSSEIACFIHNPYAFVVAVQIQALKYLQIRTFQHILHKKIEGIIFAMQRQVVKAACPHE